MNSYSLTLQRTASTMNLFLITTQNIWFLDSIFEQNLLLSLLLLLSALHPCLSHTLPPPAASFWQAWSLSKEKVQKTWSTAHNSTPFWEGARTWSPNFRPQISGLISMGLHPKRKKDPLSLWPRVLLPVLGILLGLPPPPISLQPSEQLFVFLAHSHEQEVRLLSAQAPRATAILEWQWPTWTHVQHCSPWQFLSFDSCPHFPRRRAEREGLLFSLMLNSTEITYLRNKSPISRFQTWLFHIFPHFYTASQCS